jgi:ketopantoate reductase
VQGLTGAVIQLAKKHTIATPTYEQVYVELISRMKI